MSRRLKKIMMTHNLKLPTKQVLCFIGEPNIKGSLGLKSMSIIIDYMVLLSDIEYYNICFGTS